MNKKYEGVLTEQEVKEKAKSESFDIVLGSDEIIPTSVAKYVYSNYFDALYDTFGEGDKLNDELLDICKVAKGSLA